MFKKLVLVRVNLNSFIYERFPYKIKYWLINFSGIIKSFLKIIKYTFTDFSSLGMIQPNVQLDISTMCQLKCPVCPTGKGTNKRGVIGWGYLKYQEFKKFVDKNPEIKNIELANWGEIFLNPDLKKIMKYGFLKNITLTVSSGANLNNVKPDVLESLVKYKIKYLNISLDGASNEIYQLYRKGGDFNRVIKNIKILNYFKEKYHSNYPKLNWQFIIMGHNEHEIPAARKMAHQLGMTFFTKLNRVPSVAPIKDKDFVRKESGLNVSSRNEFLKKYKRLYMTNCRLLWNSPQINWDGKLLGCTRNYWGDFGNVFETNLKDCLNSERYIYAKKMVLGKKMSREDIPCSKCPLYAFVQKKPLKKIEILVNNNIM